MDLKSEPMIFCRDEIQILANCVIFQIDQNNDDYSFKDKMQILERLNEQLDRFTAMEGGIV